jgi:hypothetical protein
MKQFWIAVLGAGSSCDDMKGVDLSLRFGFWSREHSTPGELSVWLRPKSYK